MTAPPPPGPTDRAGWQAGLRAALTERLGLKAAALVMSVLLWIVVTARQPAEGYVRVDLVPVLDSALVLLEPPAAMQALVSGRGVDIVKLYSDRPVVHRRIHGHPTDTLVVDVAPGDVHLPAALTSAVRVLDVQPRSVTLRIGHR